MEFRKALLGAASILALTAGAQRSADASIPLDAVAQSATERQSATEHRSATERRDFGIAAHEDPLFELMTRTQGSLEPPLVENALRAMLANPSPELIEAVPTVLSGLSGLGASSDTITRTKEVLVELVSNASSVSTDIVEPVLSQLQNDDTQGTFKIAQAHNRRVPGEIGQTGGGGGGGGGAPGGASSDIRLKHDIALVDRLENGLGLYHFSYNGSEQAYVGVMAQEVEAVVPEAVVKDDDGFLRVRYDMLGIRMQTWEEWVASGQAAQSTMH